MAVDPSQTSSDYQEQIDFWCMVSAILGGEHAIKLGTTSYLPKFSNERLGVYQYRLANAPFTNVYADISKNLSSKPFSKELAMKEETPDQYLKLAENIDGQGNNLHVFAATAFKGAVDKGVHWILVDFNKPSPANGRKVLSIADVKAQKLRPYWVHVAAEQMLAVYSDFVDGVEVIHHARIRETSTEVNGFSETHVTRIRVLNRERQIDEAGKTTGYRPATWEIWENVTAGTVSVWNRTDGGDLSIGEIPLVPVILTARRGGSWCVAPPLKDLAYAQISAYRQEANLAWVDVMTTFPMVCVSGMETKNQDGSSVELTVGPNTVWIIPQNGAGTGPAGTVSVVETSGAASAQLQARLELAWKKMADLGMQPMTEANLTVVTTANVSKKASSSVQAWAFLFKDSLELAWKYTAMWLGDAGFEPEVIIHTDFAVDIQGAQELDALLKAEAQGIYSKQTVREQFRRRDVVVNDIDDAEEEQRLAEEQQGLQPEQPIDPLTGLPIAPMPRPGLPMPAPPSPPIAA